MSVNYSLAVRNDRLNVVVAAIDAGAGPGILVVGVAGMSVTLAQFILDDPCGTVAAGVLSFSGLPKPAVAIGSGTAAEARITDSTGTIVASGLTVATAGADLIISKASVIVGDNLSLIAATITGN